MIHINKKKKLLIAIVCCIVLILVAILLIKNLSRKEKDATNVFGDKLASASQVESASEKNDTNYLSQKDYNSFQISKRGIARQYLGTQDFSSAKRVMSEVEQKIPQEKINSSSYKILAEIAKLQGSTTEYKLYVQKVVTTLNTEGSKQEAEQWSKELLQQ